MAIQRILWDDLDGHDVHAADLTFMNAEWTDQIERRFKAISYLNSGDTNGVATGFALGAVTDAIVVGPGTAYDDNLRGRVQITNALTIQVSPSDVGKYIVLNAATVNYDDPVAARAEAHPETGQRSFYRLVYLANVELKDVGSITVGDIRLGKVVSHTAGSAPEITQNPPDRDLLVLGSLGGQLIATPFVVVANDGSGDFEDIQSAVDFLPTTGGKIFVKPGTYTTSSSIVVDKSGVEIMGSGASTIVRLDFESKGETVLFRIGNPQEINIANPPSRIFLSGMTLTLKPLNDPTAGVGIVPVLVRFFNVVRSGVEDLILTDPRITTGCSGVEFRDNTVRCSVMDCYFVDMEAPCLCRGPFQPGSLGNRRGKIAGNIFYGSPSFAMILGKGGDSCTEFMILGNVFLGGGGDRADAIYWTKNGTITGNVAQRFRNGAAMSIFSTTVVNKGDVGCVVTGNCFVTNNNYGVNMTSANGHVATGNDFRSNTLGDVGGGTSPNIAVNNAS